MNAEILQILLLTVVVLTTILLLFRKSGPRDELKELMQKLIALDAKVTNLENSVKSDFVHQRQELNQSLAESRRELSDSIRDFKAELQAAIKNIHDLSSGSLTTINQTLAEKLENLRQNTDQAQRENRSEIKETLKSFGTEQKSKLDELNSTLRIQLDKIESKVETKLQELTNQAKADSNQMREAIDRSFKGFEERFERSVNAMSQIQKEKLDQVDKSQKELIDYTNKQLEQIRATVEEKLEKTLGDRLGQSFDTVSKQLNEVQRGLGEMQTIASEVGNLKKVLSNVKLRGTLGEVQLSILLEQMLSPNQYVSNFAIKPGSRETVEFAIKLPGRSDKEDDAVYLPIDAKFPKDVYEQLLAAYENGHPEQIDAAIKNLENVMRKNAKDIRDKYINPPYTTDFAIMFLPFESIFAEVIRRSSLIDQLRDEYKIAVAGPTTLAALLNSLQMGFRTLAIQKRSSEVWKVLGEVKVEFEKFGDLLEKAKRNIKTGLGQIDKLAGTRTESIKRKLRDVEILPSNETKKLEDENVTEDTDFVKEDDDDLEA
ncbi:DNA recombination protein RmuC [Thermaurantimonas aggregans]|uniref:DNA recombination protein RmuC n=1 Tax=Thermaurantimonas aggregans TaxID=2173829 RepID=UPI0023F529C6|nr:DNA recombination protein RmuC [Thermaurantimonas aggregans]MCX8149293.1 DNA recombination protein RmuC [Thermaurantimonas aggregans]